MDYKAGLKMFNDAEINFNLIRTSTTLPANVCTSESCSKENQYKLENVNELILVARSPFQVLSRSSSKFR
jgi:hypothetical protein